LIETYLIVGYGKQHHIVASQKEIDTTLSGYYSQSGGQAAFDTMIKTEGFTVADVKEIASASATINDVFTAVTKNIACKPCGELHARHILFKAKDKALADTVAKHLQADKGLDFAAYAKKYSTDTGSAKVGGDLGWFDNTTMVAEFTKAAFAMKIGQVSNPVKSTYGYHVIQVLGQRASRAQKNTYFTNWIKSHQKTQVVQTYVKF
jgi:foldase protein PrsA